MGSLVDNYAPCPEAVEPFYAVPPSTGATLFIARMCMRDFRPWVDSLLLIPFWRPVEFYGIAVVWQ